MGGAVAALVLATAAAVLIPAPAAVPSPPPQVPAPSGRVGAIYQLIEHEGSAGRVGALAPIFAWATPDGRLTDLAALRGRPVVITFWATWCVPCRKEMPAFDRVAARRPNVAFLEVDLQEDADTVLGFFDQLGLRHLQPILDPGARTARRYGVVALPTTFFVNPAGVVRHVEVGGPMSEQTIESRIAQGP